MIYNSSLCTDHCQLVLLSLIVFFLLLCCVQEINCTTRRIANIMQMLYHQWWTKVKALAFPCHCVWWMAYYQCYISQQLAWHVGFFSFSNYHCKMTSLLSFAFYMACRFLAICLGIATTGGRSFSTCNVKTRCALTRHFRTAVFFIGHSNADCVVDTVTQIV